MSSLSELSSDQLKPSTGAQEFRTGWNIIVASFVGVAVGLVALPFYTYGILAPTLEQEFGWQRGISQMPLIFQTIGLLLMLPVVGWATDRFGARPVALSSMAAYAISWSLFALMDGSPLTYGAIAFLLGITGAGTLPITWTRAVNGSVEIKRGLALGMALMGSGLTAFAAPSYVSWLLSTWGWQEAYLGLALLPAGFGLPIVWLLFRTSRTTLQGNAEKPAGKTFAQAWRDYRFWLIAIAFLLVSFAIGGSIPNLFALFTGNGFPAEDASSILATIGVAVILGRIGTGYLLDRFWAPAVAAVLVGLPSIACLLLIGDEISLTEAYIATALIGLAAGAEFDVIAFLAVRYFGLAHYSKIYSFLYAMFAIGAATAPSVFGFVYDSSGSYVSIFSISTGLFLFGSILLLLLGRSPDAFKA
jgi:MFS family permease